MDEWVIKLRQFQRRTGIRDPQVEALLKGYSYDRFWFDKTEVTSTVSSEEFRSTMTAEKVQDWWKSALDAQLEVEYEEEPRFDKVGYQIDKWRREMSKPSSQDRFRYEMVRRAEVIHSGISAHLIAGLWADDFQYGTSFRDRLMQYCGKLLFSIRRLW